jgi:hypothetical protein
MMLQRADECQKYSVWPQHDIGATRNASKVVVDDKSFLKLKDHQAACSVFLPYLCICVSLCLINDKKCSTAQMTPPDVYNTHELEYRGCTCRHPCCCTDNPPVWIVTNCRGLATN